MADFRGHPAPHAPNAGPMPGAIPQQRHFLPQQFPPRPPQLVVIDKKPLYAGCTYTRLLNNTKKSWKNASQTIWSMSQDAMQKAAKKKIQGGKDVTPGEAALKNLPAEAKKRIEDWLDEKTELETENRFYTWTIASIKTAKVVPLIGTGKETIDVILKRVVRPEVKDAAERTSGSPKVRRSTSLGDMRRPSFDRPPLQHHAASAMPGPRMVPHAQGPLPHMAGPQGQFNPPQNPGPGRFVPNAGPIPVPPMMHHQPPPMRQPPSPGRSFTDDDDFEDDDDDFPATGGYGPRPGPQGPMPGPANFGQGMPGMHHPPGQVPFRPMQVPGGMHQPHRDPMPTGGMNPMNGPHPQQVHLQGNPMQQPHGGMPGGQQGRPTVVQLNRGQDGKDAKQYKPEVHHVYSSDDDESAVISTDDNVSFRTSMTPSSLGEEVPLRRKSQHRQSANHDKYRAGDAGGFRQHRRRESQAGGRRHESGDDAEYVVIDKSSRRRDSRYNKKTGSGIKYMSGAIRRNSFNDDMLPKLSRNNLRKDLREDHLRQEEIHRAELTKASLKEDLHNMTMQDHKRQIEELQREKQRQQEELKEADFERRARRIAEIERSKMERLRLEDKERERDRQHRRSFYDRSPERDMGFREHGRRKFYDDDMSVRSETMYRHDDGRRHDRMRHARGPSRDYEGDRFGSFGARREMRGYGNSYYD